MATVSSLGTGSGLELESLVTKLMAVEQQPLTRLQEKETAATAKISSLGTLKSSLAALKTSVQGFVLGVAETATEKFASYGVSSSTSTVATATAADGAVAGSHTLSVTTIATAQTIKKVISSSDLPSVAGTMSIQVGSGSAVSITMGADWTLANIAAEINDAGAGVTASIISGDAGNYLSLTATDTGAANTITITGSDTTGSGSQWSDAFAYSSSAAGTWSATTPVSAALTIDGVAVTSASNTLTNISGLSISLLATGDTTLTVSADTSSTLTTLVSGFVSAYNLSNTAMSQLGAYDATTEKAGDLQGDSTLRSAKNLTRAVLFSVTTGGTSAYQNLSDIGISPQDDGSLKVDSTKFAAALKADYTAVATLMTKLGKAFDTTLDGIVGTDGSIASAVDSLNTTVTTLKDRETALSDRLTKIEAIYRAKFSALDTLISSLNSTSTYLTQLFASSSSSSS